ncbi:uncharacterized protein LOC114294200 [Camellia sinensis]|uniref:uncharacterized protein LOC114294200 n=1 Tax=Camellia sinensis TaxID=4442 RepID=UPI001035E1DB|nr:uncharacterized protein LOC114294200 [Camellia sinensis]
MTIGKIKLNADGCSKGNPDPTGYGGLFRDARRAQILGYHGKLELATRAYEQNNTCMFQILKSSDRSKKIGGSVVGHRYIHRDRRQGHDRLFADYFAANPMYSPIIFRRRFRMRRPLYLRILNAIQIHNSYFVKKQDAAYVLGLSPLQKMTAAMRILSYGVAADAVDDYIRIGESTAIQSLQQFCNSVIEIFGEEYLRSPTPTDIARLLAIREVRGFPGMLGSLDCMHWE